MERGIHFPGARQPCSPLLPEELGWGFCPCCCGHWEESKAHGLCCIWWLLAVLWVWEVQSCLLQMEIEKRGRGLADVFALQAAAIFFTRSFKYSSFEISVFTFLSFFSFLIFSFYFELQFLFDGWISTMEIDSCSSSCMCLFEFHGLSRFWDVPSPGLNTRTRGTLVSWCTSVPGFCNLPFSSSLEKGIVTP